MASDRYVIIGGSAAGMAAAQSIREMNPTGEIIVLSAEPDMPYYRPLIPLLIDERKTVDDMRLLGNGPYTAPQIEVRLNSKVTTVDPKSHRVVINNSDEMTYSLLLLATGSRPTMPSDITGTDAEGVFALRTLDDARALADRAKTTKDVVLVGGGMLNLKTAAALLDRGLRVTMVVASPEILSQIMEPDAAILVRNALERAGLRILTGRNVTSIFSGKTGVSGVALDSGGELPCQMVCIGKGVRANVEFLVGSGLHVDGGIVVDAYTATNLPDVYAAGDVAVTIDSFSGRRTMSALWTNAVEMGRCAGRNMAGHPSLYSGAFGVLNATQVADVPFVAMGVVHTKGTDYETSVVETRDSYRKLVFEIDKGSSRLVGVVLVGEIERAGLFRQMIRERMQIDAFKEYLKEHKPHYGLFLRAG